MYKHIFGPVPSRRLGISLGVDLVPKKVCSLNCIYCEVGKTTKLTTKRDEYVPYDAICRELVDYFTHDNPDPDYITFSGYGEPTLHERLGDIVALIRRYRPHIPIAVLTNGTLLADPEVRHALMQTDLVLPSLDAVQEEVFDRINRPAPAIPLQECIQGLIDFRKEYRGKVFVEVFILPGYNDGADHLAELRRVLLALGPDRIQLNTLDRPGVIEGLVPASFEDLQAIAQVWGLENVEIISKVQSREQVLSYRKDAEATILETIVRRPCTLDDLVMILGMHANEINKYLEVLESAGRLESVSQERGVFYKGK